MPETSLDHWTEWRRECALDLCSAGTQRGLRKFGYRRFRTFVGDYVTRTNAQDSRPVMDGIEATLQIRKEKPDLPIIAITAMAVQDDKDKCLKAGMNDFVAQPITIENLKQKLHTFWTIIKRIPRAVKRPQRFDLNNISS